MSFLKIKSPSKWLATRKRMREDIATDMIQRLKWELLSEKPYYGDIADTIKYDDINYQVFSTEWAPAIINQGRMPGTFVPHDKILEWVQRIKDPGATPRQQESIAYRVNKKIYAEGIAATWYVDNVLMAMEEESER